MHLKNIADIEELIISFCHSLKLSNQGIIPVDPFKTGRRISFNKPEKQTIVPVIWAHQLK